MKKKIIIGSIVLLSAIVVVIMGYIGIRHKNACHILAYMNDSVAIIEYLDGKIGIKNEKTGKSAGKFDDILSDYYDKDIMTIVVVDNGMRGYVSAVTGEMLFEPQFLYAWEVDSVSKLAACVNSDYKLGFVNIDTKEIAIPFKFDFDEDKFLYSNWNGYGSIFDFVFKNGWCIVPGNDGKLGLIDDKGEIVLPIKYTDIINWRDKHSDDIILKRPSFYEGVGIGFEVMDSTVYITHISKGSPADKNCALEIGDIILKIKTDNINDYIDVGSLKDFDVSAVLRGKSGSDVHLMVLHKNDSIEEVHLTRDEIDTDDDTYLYGIINRDLKMVVPMIYDNLIIFNGSDEEQEQDDMYFVSKDKKYGVMDQTHSLRVPVEYDDIDMAPINGLFFIATKDDKKMLLDENGKIISELYIDSFIDDIDDIDKMSYISYPAICPIKEPGSNKSSGYFLYLWDNFRKGIIDENKNIVIHANYFSISYTGNGIFACSDKYGVHIINTKQ